MKFLNILLVISLLSWTYAGLQAKDNDTIHVLSHHQTLMVTDPSRGVNEVVRWAEFPSEKVPYRKITAHLTMQCPDGMRCGAWDYLDYVLVKRKGGLNEPERNIEIIRNLTPYGSWFGKEWKFTWSQDVTDWACLLRDSVEIEYRHTGYEDHTQMGWLVTVDFEIITGKPVMEPLGLDSLWNGSFAYGDTLRPFETLVKPRTIDVPEKAKRMNMRVVQTGHGMDRPDNCSEFCTKWREIYLDQTLLNRRDMTIICGTNPLYPQSGTWVYSRSNWCPGSLAIPDIYPFKVSRSQHTLDLKMEPYVSFKPSGGWSIAAYAFFYGEPSSKNDAVLEAIIAPSVSDAYNRLNPIAFSPRILIKNNGSENLKSVQIEYGLRGRKKQKYQWTGDLPFLQTAEVALPGIVDPESDSTLFEVKLLHPNKKKDEYPFDNTGYSLANKVPVYGDSLIVAFRTNKKIEETSWQIRNAEGQIVFQRTPADSLKAETLYRDTLVLPEGYYELEVTDSNNDGLSFWANDRAGYGFVRLLDKNNLIIKDFDPDFGSFIHHSFRIEKNAIAESKVANALYLTAYEAKEFIGVDIVLDKPQDVVLRVAGTDNKMLLETKLYHFSPQIFQIGASFLEPGHYQVFLQTADGNTIRKIVRKSNK